MTSLSKSQTHLLEKWLHMSAVVYRFECLCDCTHKHSSLFFKAASTKRTLFWHGDQVAFDFAVGYFSWAGALSGHIVGKSTIIGTSVAETAC